MEFLQTYLFDLSTERDWTGATAGPLCYYPRRITRRQLVNRTAAMEAVPISEPDPLPCSGVLLGIDYGTKRVGVAVCDRNQTIASPLQNHQRQGAQGDARFFRKVVEEYLPVGIVVGLPVHMSGDESKKSGESRRFGQWLHETTQLPVCYFDERFTSAHAESLLLQTNMTKKQRKARIDKLAAQILLQNFLNARQKS